MKTFVGIGLGPIQTGIFLDGAFRGGFDRLVVADVDAALIDSIRADHGTLQLNIASNTAVSTERITGVEMYNPLVAADREKLVEAAAQADEVATALPSIAFFKHLDWLREGFACQPERRRFVYAAENHNHAAEELEKAVGSFPATRVLNTVVGKMSGILSAEECAQRSLVKLTPQADRGHLVEAFNRILIQSCDGIEERQVQGLVDKPNLLPFEEAKLYGHNAIHFWLGLHAQQKNLQCMHELSGEPDLLGRGRQAFVDECGTALCRKWAGEDALFTPEGFAAYADDLIERMTNPFLTDRVDRICRDLERKLGWDDRVIGTLRLCLSQQIEAPILMEGARKAVQQRFGEELQKNRAGLETLWGAWGDEHQQIWKQLF